MEKIYITKICTAGIFSYKRIDEEFATLTEEKALECLKNDFFEQNPSQKDLETYN